jgi:hypothetical protein
LLKPEDAAELAARVRLYLFRHMSPNLEPRISL